MYRSTRLCVFLTSFASRLSLAQREDADGRSLPLPVGGILPLDGDLVHRRERGELARTRHRPSGVIQDLLEVTEAGGAVLAPDKAVATRDIEPCGRADLPAVGLHVLRQGDLHRDPLSHMALAEWHRGPSTNGVGHNLLAHDPTGLEPVGAGVGVLGVQRGDERDGVTDCRGGDTKFRRLGLGGPHDLSGREFLNREPEHSVPGRDRDLKLAEAPLLIDEDQVEVVLLRLAGLGKVVTLTLDPGDRNRPDGEAVVANVGDVLNGFLLSPKEAHAGIRLSGDVEGDPLGRTSTKEDFAREEQTPLLFGLSEPKAANQADVDLTPRGRRPCHRNRAGLPPFLLHTELLGGAERVTIEGVSEGIFPVATDVCRFHFRTVFPILCVESNEFDCD